MSYPFVPVYERVIADQRKPERRGFGRQGWIGFHPAGRHAGLCDSRFQGSQVTNTRGSARLRNESSVELNHFPEGEIPHSGKPTIQRFVSRKDVRRGAFEILCRASEEVADRCGSQIAYWHVQPFGGLSELALGITSEIQGDGHGWRMNLRWGNWEAKQAAA